MPCEPASAPADGHAADFAREIVKNDDEGFPFAFPHNRIVPLAREYLRLAAALTAAEAASSDWRKQAFQAQNDLQQATGRALAAEARLREQEGTA